MNQRREPTNAGLMPIYTIKKKNIHTNARIRTATRTYSRARAQRTDKQGTKIAGMPVYIKFLGHLSRQA